MASNDSAVRDERPDSGTGALATTGLACSFGAAAVSPLVVAAGALSTGAAGIVSDIVAPVAAGSEYAVENGGVS